jgi:ribose transport system substrate-binding protein
MIQSKRVVVIGVLTLLVAALSACSSSNSSSVNTSGVNTSGVNTSGVNTSGLESAQNYIKQYVVPPTSIPVTDSLPHKPGPGSLIYFGINLPSSIAIYSAIHEAAGAAGWQSKQVIYDYGNPSSLQSAMTVALQEHPTVVIVAGTAPDQIGQTVMGAYQSANLPIIFDAAVPVTTSKLVYAADGEAGGQLQGAILANWFVADSGGKGNALLEITPVLTVFKAMAAAFQSVVAQKCGSACSVTIVDITPQQSEAGQIPTIVVSKLRTDPKINYVFAANGVDFVGLNSEMAAAGLKNIKIGGAGAQPADYQALRAGTQQAWVPIDANYNGYCLVDMALRVAQGVNPGNECNPLMSDLLTHQNVGDAGENYKIIPDELQQFENLWHVG